jgi:hypothetical protein
LHHQGGSEANIERELLNMLEKIIANKRSVNTYSQW